MPDLTVNHQGPRYAVFGCQTHRDKLAAGWDPDDSEVEEMCDDEFAGRLPHISVELPSCPTCGGPSILLDTLSKVY